jgi:hypothetical protein
MAKRRRMRNEQPAEDLLEMCSSQIGIFACAGMAQLIVEFASANLFELHSFWSLSKDCNKQVQNFVQKLFTTGALFLYPCAFKMLPYMPGYDCSFVYRALEFQGAALLQNWSLWMGIGHKRIRPCYIDRFTSFAFVSKDLEDDSYSEDSFAGREEGFFVAYDQDQRFAICLYGYRYEDEVDSEDSEFECCVLHLGDGSATVRALSVDTEAYKNAIPWSPHLWLYPARICQHLYVTGKYISELKKLKPHLWPSYARSQYTQWREALSGARVLE